MTGALAQYLGTLGLTVGIEVALVYLLSRHRLDLRLVLATALFLNLLTHPLATLLTWNRGWMFGEIELAVFLVEILGYRTVARQSWPRAAALALVANLATALLAIAVFAAGGG